MKKSVKKCVNVLGMLGTVWFASTLLFGCEANDVTPVEENDKPVVVEEKPEEAQPDVKEETPIVEEQPEIQQQNEFDLNAFIEEINVLGQDASALNDPAMAVYDHLDKFIEFKEQSDELLVDQFVSDMELYNMTGSTDELLAVVKDLGELDKYYTDNTIHEVWLIFGHLYDIQCNAENYEEPTYEYTEPEDSYVYEEPVQEQPQQRQSTLMVYYINARVSSYNTLAYDSKYGTANEQGYDYVIYDFIDGAVLIGGDSLVRLNISCDDGATALTLSQIDSSFDYYEVRDMLRNNY